jgi:hypothetical protein
MGKEGDRTLRIREGTPSACARSRDMAGGHDFQSGRKATKTSRLLSSLKNFVLGWQRFTGAIRPYFQLGFSPCRTLHRTFSVNCSAYCALKRSRPAALLCWEPRPVHCWSRTTPTTITSNWMRFGIRRFVTNLKPLIGCDLLMRSVICAVSRLTDCLAQLGKITLVTPLSCRDYTSITVLLGRPCYVPRSG